MARQFRCRVATTRKSSAAQASGSLRAYWRRHAATLRPAANIPFSIQSHDLQVETLSGTPHANKGSEGNNRRRLATHHNPISSAVELPSCNEQSSNRPLFPPAPRRGFFVPSGALLPLETPGRSCLLRTWHPDRCAPLIRNPSKFLLPVPAVKLLNLFFLAALASLRHAQDRLGGSIILFLSSFASFASLAARGFRAAGRSASRALLPAAFPDTPP